jgi:hypothetical protein
MLPFRSFLQPGHCSSKIHQQPFVPLCGHTLPPKSRDYVLPPAEPILSSIILGVVSPATKAMRTFGQNTGAIESSNNGSNNSNNNTIQQRREALLQQAKQCIASYCLATAAAIAASNNNNNSPEDNQAFVAQQAAAAVGIVTRKQQRNKNDSNKDNHLLAQGRHP